jgi:Phosphotransferase enzyme family
MISSAPPLPTPTGARPRPLPPADPQVPGLRVLLDAPRAAVLLAAAAGPGRMVSDVAVRFVDYVPGRRVRVLYEALVNGTPARVGATLHARSQDGLRNDAPRQLIENARVPTPAAAAVTIDPGLGCEIAWLPADPRLPGLWAPVHRIRQEVAMFDAMPPPPRRSLLGYRMGERAVMGMGRLVLKAYGDPDAFARAIQAHDLAYRHAGIPVARFLGAVPSLRLSVLERVIGDGLQRADAAQAAGEVGELLARLHRAAVHSPTVAGPRVHLERAAQLTHLTTAIAPHLTRAAQKVLARLEKGLPRAGFVPCHGDFNVGQLMRREDDLVALDFDELAMAPAALDLAGYAADLIAGRHGDLAGARTTLDSLLAGYGSRPDGLAWYLAALTLRRAPNSFRLWKSRWPERLESMIAAADEVLAW